HFGEQGGRTSLEPGAVGIDAGYACRGKQFGKILFHALRAAPHGFEILIAAIGAGTGHAGLVAAMMTLQMVAPGARPMQHGIGGAAGALTYPTARRAIEHRGITTPIQENERLLAGVQPLAQSLDELG